MQNTNFVCFEIPVEVEVNLSPLALSAGHALVKQGVLAFDGSSFCPRIPLDAAVRHIVDVAKPAAERMALYVTLARGLVACDRADLALRVKELAKQSAPSLEIRLRNGIGGSQANSKEFEEVCSALRASGFNDCCVGVCH